MVWLTVGTTVGVMSPLILWRWHVSNRAGRADESPETEQADENEYAAVSILPGLITCDAVEKFVGRRILEDDAPPLPVSGCDEDHCQCRYQYHADRRSGDDRRNPFAATMADTLGPNSEKRAVPDRRHAASEKKPAKPRAYFNDYN